MRKKRKFFCTGEVKEPIVDNKIICKVGIFATDSDN